jgi:NADH dehydrogenase
VILVTGATGFVGSNIIKELVSQGYQVRGLVHSQRDFERLKGLPIETVTGDITNFDSLTKPFEGVQTVFSCVGIIYETKSANFDSIHVLGTRSLVEMALKNKVRHFIHTSALGTRPNAVSRYHQSKFRAEQIIQDSGLTYTIFRPSILFGPEDDFVNRFARMLKYNPVFPLVGEGKSRLQPLYIKDLARCVVASLKTPEAKNKIFEIGGPRAMTLLEILEAVKKFRGYGRRFHPHLPYTTVFNFVKFAEKFLSALPVTTDQLLMLQEDNICDNSSAERTFGIKLTSLEEGLPQYWSD